MASTTLIVKITHGTEIRRFTTSKDDLNWKDLAKRACKLFDLAAWSETSKPAKSIKFTYVDDEGDQITLSSDLELAEAITIALATAPAVLRLTLVEAHHDSKSTTTDVTMSDASTNAERTSTTDASTTARPTTTEASTGNPARPPGGGMPPEFTNFLRTLEAQLPELASQLPSAARQILQNGELDVAATLAATEIANAACSAASAASAFGASAASAAASASANAASNAGPAAPLGVHPGVRCDRTGQSPIVGNRYNLAGQNYDLCEEEYNKLTDAEKSGYIKIPPPVTRVVNINGSGPSPPTGFHPGVECDRSGMCPIVGIRYKLNGFDYDLCQAEFDKLSSTEKLQYTAISPPAFRPAGKGGHGWGGRGWGGRGWGCGGPWARAHGVPPGAPHAPSHGGPDGTPHPRGPAAGGPCNKLAARFVRDVTIFDGTQVAPSTTFTKIWRLKNTGEVPWPPGTKMVFVGGDHMTYQMAVPVCRSSPVQPGEEVDVAVEMSAPAEHGRYLGYWRLAGPWGRRFGHRVWCHIQVIDPDSTFSPSEEDLRATLEEIARKKRAVTTAHEEDADADVAHEAEQAAAAPSAASAPSAATAASAASAVTSAAMIPEPSRTAENPVEIATQPPAAAAESTTPEPAAEAAAADSASDDGVVVDANDLSDPAPSPLPSAASSMPSMDASSAAPARSSGANAPHDPSTPEGVKAALATMGFTDATMVDVAITKHGADLDACASDLALATEWDSLLDDLAEMGFQNRELNKTLMLRHDGNLKRTVKALVEDE